LESVLRAVVVYAAFLVAMRLTGRRALGQMTSFDLLLLLVISETAQQALMTDDSSIANALLVALTLFATDFALTYAKTASPRLARWLDGQPTVLISLGRVDERALRRARVDLDDILQAARKTCGLERLDQIRFAVLETDGGISIVPARDARRPPGRPGEAYSTR
jgi:uncharacterized membrane protein YcaP (DUF421 family)